MFLFFYLITSKFDSILPVHSMGVHIFEYDVVCYDESQLFIRLVQMKSWSTLSHEIDMVACILPNLNFHITRQITPNFQVAGLYFFV